MISKRGLRLTSLLLAGTASPLVLIGCPAPDAVESVGTVAFDSAGVNVITGYSPRARSGNLLDSATLIAEFGESEITALGFVTAAVRLDGGQIVFIDFDGPMLQLFDPADGTLITLARPGHGPGEVVFPVDLQRLDGDSVQFYDRRHGRVSVLSPDGRLAYEISMVHAQGRPLRVFRAADSVLVALYPLPDTAHIIARSDVGELRSTQRAVVLHDLRGTRSDTIVLIPGARTIETRQSSMRPVWGLGSHFAVVDDEEFAVANGETYSLRIVDQRGMTRRVERLSIPRKPVDRDSLTSMLRRDKQALHMLGTTAERHPLLEPAFLPDSQPAFKSMRMFDSELWLGSAEPFNLPSRTWRVLSRSGEWLAEVGVPDDARILDIRDNVAVLARSGRFDEQTIQVYLLADTRM